MFNFVDFIVSSTSILSCLLLLLMFLKKHGWINTTKWMHIQIIYICALYKYVLHTQHMHSTHTHTHTHTHTNMKTHTHLLLSLVIGRGSNCGALKIFKHQLVAHKLITDLAGWKVSTSGSYTAQTKSMSSTHTSICVHNWNSISKYVIQTRLNVFRIGSGFGSIIIVAGWNV